MTKSPKPASGWNLRLLEHAKRREANEKGQGKWQIEIIKKTERPQWALSGWDGIVVITEAK